MEINLLPGERLDDLLIDDLKIIQKEREFCFSLDAILLAHFASVRQGCAAVDLGAGTGVLGLLLVARGAANVVGVELSSHMMEMAQRSADLNGLNEQLSFLCCDVREIKQSSLASGQWDLVVSNPPYRKPGHGFISPTNGVAAAKHELKGTLRDFIAAARYLIKYRGRLAMVHLPERTAEVLKEMSDAGIEPKRLQLVYPAPGKRPKLLLVEGVRGGSPGIDALPPLFVYGADGRYSPEIMAFYPKDCRVGEHDSD
jgi:tRNA1(Val) A37 N6-methylase TrmN6